MNISNKNILDLSGKIAVVTGGMGQLGMEYVAAFVNHGASVAIIDIIGTPKNPTADFENSTKTGRIKSFTCNIANINELRGTLSDINNSFGIPDILVNNAALDSPPGAPIEEVGPFETYPVESFDKVMEVNVKGTFLCCQVIGGQMAQNGRGAIINISSTYGILSPCQDIYEFRRKKGEVFFKPVAYSVSKSAILNLTRYLATYWAQKGVRVNTLTPGGIFNNQPAEFLEAYCQRVPMGRMANANEMVGAALYLASDAASYVTGTNLVVDGGWSAW
jgi:NAD(P)-dependent dehydrogenase (short-subunit alcohol dehydrogenase family)